MILQHRGLVDLDTDKLEVDGNRALCKVYSGAKEALDTNRILYLRARAGRAVVPFCFDGQ